MNVNLLIDNIVRQTTLLIAQLATAAGGRTPLSHVASQVFLNLVSELKSQGLGNKVIADMFGLALRTYHDRVRRLSESATDRGMSLWGAVLSYVRSEGLVTRAALLRRFHADDEVSVRGVLKDLVDGGLLFKSGRADSTSYRAADSAELDAMAPDKNESAVLDMARVMLHQMGPSSYEQLAERLAIAETELKPAVDTLIAEGAVKREGAKLVAQECIIPFEAEHGWEAAVFDHFQALVTSIAAKVTSGQTRARTSDATGGSTYHYDLYPGHPQEAEVQTLLNNVRQQAGQLRKLVKSHPTPQGAIPYRAVFYVGGNLLTQDELNNGEPNDQ